MAAGREAFDGFPPGGDPASRRGLFTSWAAGRGMTPYTDGVTEARLAYGPERPLFGDAALCSALTGCRGLSAADTLENIIAKVRDHTRGQTSDDAALLALHLPTSR
jgi:hypothetical protein